jgi:hypothetical protein
MLVFSAASTHLVASPLGARQEPWGLLRRHDTAARRGMCLQPFRSGLQAVSWLHTAVFTPMKYRGLFHSDSF